ncbi:MAG: 5-formyltetrahydrofolate cyclo-ligase [Devosiaceae bacterium]|nr:5-formyltetrahydrofolate cyclo-ligase [Devosiaceae bacterium]
MNAQNTPQIDLDKAKLRDRIKSERAKLSSEERAKFSQQVEQLFLLDVPFNAQSKIALYWPIGDEVDCKELIFSLTQQGVELGLPTIVGREKPLIFRRYEGEQKLVPAQFGTLEPDPHSPPVVPDIIVLPLLAFDKTGARLGYGGGFYDRTIGDMKLTPMLVGLAFDAQELDFVPVDSHDIGLDMVITQTGTRRFNKKGPGR